MAVAPSPDAARQVPVGVGHWASDFHFPGRGIEDNEVVVWVACSAVCLAPAILFVAVCHINKAELSVSERYKDAVGSAIVAPPASPRRVDNWGIVTLVPEDLTGGDKKRKQPG